jgi:predicted  nucleic acid-binding Zn-ribbon protein
MSEEEQKAIEYLKTYMLPYFGEGKEIEFYLNEVLLNLIEKQQKEIETWKETENDYEHELARKDEKIEKQQKEIKELKEELQRQINTRLINEKYMENNFVSKDEIKEKINQLEEQCKKELLTTWLESQIDILKELLGE